MNTRVHVSLPVADVDRSVAFYEAFFGQPATRRKPGYANFRLDVPSLHLSLTRGSGGSPRAFEHFGVEVFEDEALRAWLDRARKAGLEVRTEEKTTCCYALLDRFWVKDPDDNDWEVWVRRADLDEETRDAGACCAPG